jgi:VanZ family protein
MSPWLPVSPPYRALAFAAVALIAFQLLVLPEPAYAERLVAATWDKLVHASVFGAVAALLWAGFGGRHAALICAMVLLLGALDETHQLFVPGRDPDLHDLYADGLGAVATLLFLEAVSAPRIVAATPLPCGD